MLHVDDDNRRLLLYSVFAIALGLAFRTASDMHDALSWRNATVGWFAWHTINAASRDFWQAVLVIYISVRALMREKIIGKPAVFYIAANLAVSAWLSYIWHNFVYEWTLDNLKYFDW